ncbi:hypothetical protein Micbo1qcDRAFT_179880 [Microdochium bolleyi]|uniref:MARVEL domain-containing protein n=1 Tax=Microdochium bolleyi TaxID=196109 RepID=A0A136IN42_9PEZI|nr:hypothetical protein Micbo1qcDRAFT_179880 [Microdochium bolleyi]
MPKRIRGRWKDPANRNRMEQSQGFLRLPSFMQIKTRISNKVLLMYPNLPLRKQAMRDYWQLSGPFGLALRAALRIFQFIFSIVTIGFYGASLASWDTSTTSVKKTNWIFALVPAVISATTCAYHVFATVTHVAWSIWDFCLAVLWAALCGISGSLLVGRGGGNNVTGDLRANLKAGAWVAGVSMILWLLSSIHGCAYCCASRKTTRIAKQEGDEVELEEFSERRQQRF